MRATEPLPVLGLIGESLRDVFGRLGGLARIAWAYYALAAALVLLGLTAGRAAGETMPAGALAAAFAVGTAEIVLSLAVLACIVRWQRHVALDEPLRRTAPLDGRVLLYFLRSVLLGLICSLPAAAAALLGFATGAIVRNPDGSGAPFGIGTAGITVLAGGTILGLLLFARLNLVLPAASVGDRELGLHGSWAATRGHGLRLLAVFLLLLSGLGLLGAVAGMLEALVGAVADATAGPDGAGAPSAAPLVAGAVLDAALDLLAAVVGASATARIYLRLAPGPRAPAGAA
jgi:hypothetical protein